MPGLSLRRYPKDNVEELNRKIVKSDSVLKRSCQHLCGIRFGGGEHRGLENGKEKYNNNTVGYHFQSTFISFLLYDSHKNPVK